MRAGRPRSRGAASDPFCGSLEEKRRAGGPPLGWGAEAPWPRVFPPALWRFAQPRVKG